MLQVICNILIITISQSKLQVRFDSQHLPSHKLSRNLIYHRIFTLYVQETQILRLSMGALAAILVCLLIILGISSNNFYKVHVEWRNAPPKWNLLSSDAWLILSSFLDSKDA